MDRADERITLYRGAAGIVVTAVLAAVFAFRAVQAAAGASTLSGPVWVTIDVLLAVASTVRCFDRVVLSRDGVTIVRVGFPTRLVPGRIHEFLVTTAGSSTRLVAQQTNGTRLVLASGRTDTDRARRLHQFRERSTQRFAGRFGLLAVTETHVDGATPTPTPRRCVRPACPAHRTPVTDELCLSCGDRTQRINTESATG
jgi:hypothetical protein